MRPINTSSLYFAYVEKRANGFITGKPECCYLYALALAIEDVEAEIECALYYARRSFFIELLIASRG